MLGIFWLKIVIDPPTFQNTNDGHETILLSPVLYGYEMQSLTAKVEHYLLVSEK
jgi:hypothetical protein